MAHYAFLDQNNIVTEVITGIDETEQIEGLSPEIWYANFRGQTCKRTSYNGKIRKQFASIGFKYLEDEDIFIAPRPYPSWNLDNFFNWRAPKQEPTDGKIYIWNEAAQEWQNLETFNNES